MPQLGETVTEGTITAWCKHVGDPIEVDEALFEVSTEKVDTEVPSAVPGFLRAILVPEGDTVPIGTPVAIVTATADEPFDAEEAEPASVEAAVALAEEPAVAGSAASASAPAASTPARPPARPRPTGGSGAVLTPVVRRLLDEQGLTEDAVVGSGRDGRVTRADVLAAAAQRHAAPSNGHGATPPAPAAASGMPDGLTAADLAARLVPSAAPVADDDEVLDLSRARLATAEHMMRSLATSAHALVATAVDYVDIDRVRRNAGLSYLPFVARAVIEALRNRPHLNASVGDGQLIVHRAIHLGIAVDVADEALVVPVVHDADRLRLPALADAIADLAERTRRRRVTTGELTGGTFTITNVGASGTLVTAPIINQPQVAILSTDGVKMQPVAVRTAGGDWATAVHPVGNLCLSFDHRAVDGAYAASFLADVRELLETRDWAEEVRRP